MSTRSASEHRHPVLVMLHGFALHSGLWADLPDALATWSEPRAIDLPGHGTRPWDTRIADLASLARVVSEQIPTGAIVLGWSLGGMVALELARQRPATLGGLVLIATTPRFVGGPNWPHGVDPQALETFARGVRDDYHRTVQEFLALQTLGAADSRATLRLLRAGVRSRPAPDPRALECCLDILRHADLREALRDVTVEALVITGEHDRLTRPAAGAVLAMTLPRARLRQIAGAGHAPFMSHPAVVRDELASFIDQLQRASAAPAQAAG